MENIYVSVIIPVYNAEKFLDRCLKSVFSQSMNEYEVIIVNDGSTDYSYEIIQNYKQKFPQKTKIISQKNMGIAKSRNLAISIAQGKYISFIDADDYIDFRFLEVLYNEAVENDADISCCNYYKYNEKKNKKYKHILSMPQGCYSRTKALKTLISDNRLQYYVWNKLFKRSFLLKNDIKFSNICFEDVEFSVKSFYFANKVAVSKKALYYYVKHSNSMIAYLDMLKVEDYLKVLASIRVFLENQNNFQSYKLRFILHSIKVFNAACQDIFHNLGISKKAFICIKKAAMAVRYYNSRKFKSIKNTKELGKIF